MPEVQEASSFKEHQMPPPPNPEERKKGKFVISFPDGTTGAFDSWEQATAEMQKYREH